MTSGAPSSNPEPPQADDVALTDEDVSRLLAGIWRLGRSLKQEVEPLMQQRFQVDLRQSFILRNIRNGCHYPKHLSEELEVPATLISRYLDGLLKLGLIERHIDAQDSRRTRLALTPTGETVTDQAFGLFRERTRERLGDTTPGEVRAATRLLERLLGSQPSTDKDPT